MQVYQAAVARVGLTDSAVALVPVLLTPGGRTGLETRRNVSRALGTFSLKSTFLTLLNEFFITTLLYYKTTRTDGTDPSHDRLHTPTMAKEE